MCVFLSCMFEEKIKHKIIDIKNGMADVNSLFVIPSPCSHIKYLTNS